MQSIIRKLLNIEIRLVKSIFEIPEYAYECLDAEHISVLLRGFVIQQLVFSM